MENSQLHLILESFDPITLEEMDNVKLMNRVDTKFVFTFDTLLAILPQLNSYYKILLIEGKKTPSYESIYYDDNNLNFYNDHHRKRLNRFKVRYRKYIESNIAFLEVKHKNKGRTNKSRILVDGLHSEMPKEHSDFVYSTGVPKKKLKAILVNKFNRMTLVGKTMNERLTLDINLEFKSTDSNYQMTNIVIAELKQKKVSRKSPFFKITKESQIRPYRISKYCIGLINLLGEENLKHNRFKKKLLKLNKIKKHAV